MSSLGTPTTEQLAAARSAQWHQNAEPILTINMLRDWLNTAGLVLFTPRAGQLPAPAPSFVEAVLGAANAAPTLADSEQSRSLLARLVLDGGAVPLNLLGSPAGAGEETPDFIVSPLAFPYLFTLRGDKTWKQPPTTSGAARVSPLALNTYALLADRAEQHATGMNAYDLATQLGKEVTEKAVLRALTELWQHLRVFPVPQLDGAATLWELMSTRFTKQIKAGANAGQPTALSALISLYLGQAIVASEEEIETFLSPVASRSRIRDVVHALMAARQLETIAVEGRTVLHVAGELPAFLAADAQSPDAIKSLPLGEDSEDSSEAPRITKFIPKPRKVGTGFVVKPGRAAGDASNARERRPFTRESNRPDRPSFTKPWAEEKEDRLAAAQAPSNVSGDAEPSTSQTHPRTSDGEMRRDRKPGFDHEGERPSFGSRPSFGGRPDASSRSRSGSDRPASGGDRSVFRRENDLSGGRPPRRSISVGPYDSSAARDSGADRPRKTFSKPGTFGRKREGFAAKPGFGRDRADSGTGTDGRSSRPPRGDFGDSRPPHREYVRRPGADSGDSRPPRRNFGNKPAFDADGPRKPGSFSAHPQRGFGGGERPDGSAARKHWTPREGSKAATARGAGPSGYSRDRDDRAPRTGSFGKPGDRAHSGGRGEARAERPAGPPFRKFDAPRAPRPFSSDRPERSDRPGRPDRPASPDRSSRPSRAPSGYAPSPGGNSFGAKKGYAKASGGPGKPASTFDKFKDNKKPFGKRPPARKFKPEQSA